MSLVNLLNVRVLENNTPFLSPFKFDITFECVASLQEDLEWKIIYVGSAESEEHDQILDSIMVGPVPIGINNFVFQADSPNPDLIPSSELLGVTVVLVICSYLDQEFIRVGYYVDNDYEDLSLRESPPQPAQIDLLKRNILADKPRVTRFNIKWDPSKLADEDIPQDILNVKIAEEDIAKWSDGEEEEEEEEEDNEEDNLSNEEASVDEDSHMSIESSQQSGNLDLMQES